MKHLFKKLFFRNAHDQALKDWRINGSTCMHCGIMQSKMEYFPNYYDLTSRGFYNLMPLCPTCAAKEGYQPIDSMINFETEPSQEKPNVIQ